MERIENFVDIFQLNREQECYFSTFVSEVEDAFQKFTPEFVSGCGAFFVVLTPPEHRHQPVEKINEDKSFKCGIGWVVLYKKIKVYDKRISGDILFVLQRSLSKYRVVHYHELKIRESENKLRNSEKKPQFRRLRSLRGAIQFLETWQKNNKNEKSSQYCLTSVPLTPESNVWYYILNEKLYKQNKTFASFEGLIESSISPLSTGVKN